MIVTAAVPWRAAAGEHMSYGTGLTPPHQQPFPTALAQPERAPGAAIAPAPASTVTLPAQSAAGRRAWVWLWPVLALLALALIAYFVTFLGAAASIIGLVAALIPYAIVIATVVLIDRWEPEPKGLVFFALAWGGVASVAFTLLFDLALTIVLPARGDFFTSVLQAPLVEEGFKGLGLLLVFWMGRRAFDGPVDGVVYGAMIGAGFAFTENIQYFAISTIEGGAAQLGFTFFLRAILSPFAHAMFTACTGFALGLAARRGLRFTPALALAAVGYVAAVLLHALWNGASFVVGGGLGGFLGYYVVLQVPIFALFVWGVVMLRREEARLTRERLGDYAAVGWFTPEEVDMLATPAGRRAAKAWAAGLPGGRGRLMSSFIRDAASLAAARQRAISGRDPQAAHDEHVLLARIGVTRQALLSS
jgi:RsiW-degrading membrane proteinase PrsW (M82 family)